MAAIDRDLLLEDVNLYMRSDNVFTDDQMNSMIDNVISDVGDDDGNYSEVLCKSLKSIANANKLKSSDVTSYKSIRTEELWEEFHKGDYTNTWDAYLDSLEDVCTDLGYDGSSLSAVGIMINPGNAVVYDVEKLKETIVDSEDEVYEEYLEGI